MKTFLFLSFFVVLMGCSKEEDKAPPPGTLELKLEHQVDGDSLQFSQMIYTNAAGNTYRVVRLKYFISGVKLYTGGKAVYEQSSEPAPINALYTEDSWFSLTDVPPGSYDSLSICMGVVPGYNYQDAFPLSNDNWDMYWPTSLGGGYHFMKFEGHWEHKGAYGGYAFHIGQNENLITTGFPVQLQLQSNEQEQVSLIMNVNQWFEDPFLYDLSKEGGYTMGDTVQMGMLVSNGHKVFSLKQE